MRYQADWNDVVSGPTKEVHLPGTESCLVLVLGTVHRVHVASGSVKQLSTFAILAVNTNNGHRTDMLVPIDPSI
jgi:hypothetical protein